MIQAFIRTRQAPFKTQYPEIVRYVSANLQLQRVLYKAETSGKCKIQKSYSNIKYLASTASFLKSPDCVLGNFPFNKLIFLLNVLERKVFLGYN